MRAAVQIHPADSVGVALQTLPAGTRTEGVVLTAEVPAGHKFALRDLAAGEPVV
jgi:altronate hydrolase